ncbi:hypothetical protein F4780DRAFT_714913 [Xylariomycetidae sp. FL0641]|nr:hypothetical protein F4780DRAFT_714913 [Xylariomycetidae sp. FL0641]
MQLVGENGHRYLSNNFIGPVIGGALAQANWRWVSWSNLPWVGLGSVMGGQHGYPWNSWHIVLPLVLVFVGVAALGFLLALVEKHVELPTIHSTDFGLAQDTGAEGQAKESVGSNGGLAKDLKPQTGYA